MEALNNRRVGMIVRLTQAAMSHPAMSRENVEWAVKESLRTYKATEAGQNQIASTVLWSDEGGIPQFGVVIDPDAEVILITAVDETLEAFMRVQRKSRGAPAFSLN
jgi:hypothetical protein